MQASSVDGLVGFYRQQDRAEFRRELRALTQAVTLFYDQGIGPFVRRGWDDQLIGSRRNGGGQKGAEYAAV
jgi:hypothetical protein